MASSTASVSRLVDTAMRLRKVRAARDTFLANWRAETGGSVDKPRETTDDKIADPFDRDWSLMYRGSVLDD